MKRTISYKTELGTTGEIFLDTAEFSDNHNEFAVTSSKMETIKGRVVVSKEHGGCLKVIPAKPLEIKGKKYGHVTLFDPVAAREFKEAFDEMYEVYKWEKQTIVTETDKEQLAKPTYFFTTAGNLRPTCTPIKWTQGSENILAPTKPTAWLTGTTYTMLF